MAKTIVQLGAMFGTALVIIIGLKERYDEAESIIVPTGVMVRVSMSSDSDTKQHGGRLQIYIRHMEAFSR